MVILVILVIAGALFSLQRMLYSRYWDRGLSAELTFSAHRVNEGDHVDMDELVSSRKLLPLPWLGLKFHVSRDLVFPDDPFTSVSDWSYREELFSIGAFQQIRRRHHVFCRRRGFFTFKSIDLISSDLLASNKLATQVASAASLYVFPRPVPERELDIPIERVNGELLTRRHLVEDPFEFIGIREYHLDDPLKSINWKATARTGGLMVNVRGHTSTQAVELLVNVEYPSLWSEERLIEDAIRVAATLADRLTAEGLAVGMRANGRDIVTRENPRVPAGSSDDHMIAVNESLARLDLHLKPRPFADLLDECLLEADDGPLFLLVSAAFNDDILDRFRALRDHGMRCLWILPHPVGQPVPLDADLAESGLVITREVVNA
ncbi:MAG: DUF58 domain-containing protein [Clostridia bacterium]|nr:DUF58 domain-containing protein [Clostridia bacterium]